MFALDSVLKDGPNHFVSRFSSVVFLLMLIGSSPRAPPPPPIPSQAQHSSISFSFEQLEFPSQLCVFIDPIKVAQAFRNLVNNAFENTPAGGSITVRTLRVCQENHVRTLDSL
jgi:signal transduction histidine kinase